MAEEQSKLNEQDWKKLQFIQYVSLLANGGMQHLGKIINPFTGKMEKNLEAASATIELLSILKEKTKGNLTQEEEEVLSGALSNLQLNYADEVNRAEKEKDKGKPGD